MTPETLAAIHRAAFTNSRPWSPDEFVALLADPMVFLVQSDQTFALGRAITNEAELLTLATAPQNRRQGAARAIMLRFHQTAAERGAARVFLEVAADNCPALTLYRNIGYQQCGLRPRYYARSGKTSVDAVVMERALLL